MKTTKEKDIGVGFKAPKESCTDSHCPFHGTLKVHGRVFEGLLRKTDPSKTVTFIVEEKHYIRKYERYEKKMKKLRVHNPPCINARAGDTVRIAECRPISKTKKFVIVGVMKR
jgi:small subunit ribosomal protein S17